MPRGNNAADHAGCGAFAYDGVGTRTAENGGVLMALIPENLEKKHMIMLGVAAVLLIVAGVSIFMSMRGNSGPAKAPTLEELGIQSTAQTAPRKEGTQPYNPRAPRGQ